MVAALQVFLLLASLFAPVPVAASITTVVYGAQTPSPVTPGSSATYSVTVTSGGTSRAVEVTSVAGLPTGAGFSSTCVTANSSGSTSATLTITTTGATPVGTVTLTPTVTMWNSTTCGSTPTNATYSAGTVSLVVGSSAASKLVVTSISPASPTAGTPFSVTVTAQNSSNIATNVLATTAVTLSLATGTGPLGGTLSGSIAAGTPSFTFTNVTSTKAETGVSITATRTSGDTLTAGTSATFAVVAAAASKLGFVIQPGGGTGGVAWATQPDVAVQDQYGNTVSGSTASVSLAIANDAGPGGVLTCTSNPMNAVAGLASYAGCKIDKSGTGYTLTATSGVLTAATSDPFNVTVGSANKLVFTTQPGGGTGGTALATQPVVTVQDAGGNTVTGSSASVTLAIGTNAGPGGVLTCATNPATAVSGVATFSGCAIDKTGAGYTLTAAASGTAGATSSALTISTGPAAKLAITSVNGGLSPVAGVAFSVTVQAQDAGGNAANVSGTTGVSLSVFTGAGVLGGTTTGSITSGTSSVVINGVTYAPGEAGVVLSVATTSGPALTGGVSAPFTVTPGPTITSITPSALGRGATTQNLTVTGANFQAGINALSVAFSGTGITVISATRNTATNLTVQVTVDAAAATGSRDMTVTNPDGGAGTGVAAFTVNAAGLSPTTLGQGATNQTVTFTGPAGTFPLGPVYSVAVSGTGVTVTNVSAGGSTSITAKFAVAALATTGFRTITVSGTSGFSTLTLTNAFSVGAGPTISSVSPATLGQGVSSRTVTITGTGFVSGATVAISGTGLTLGSVSFVNATTLTVPVTVAAGATLTARDVTVANPDAGAATAVGALTIVGGPVVGSAFPSSRGQGAAGALITVSGTGFTAGAIASFSGAGITVNTTTVDSSSQLILNITIAGGASTGARDLTVTNLDGGASTGLGAFTVNAAPVITSVIPSAVAQGASGQTVVITGTGFISGAGLAISGTGISISSVVFNSSTRLTATIDVVNGASVGARDVTVTNPDGGLATSAGALAVNAAYVSPGSMGQGTAGTVLITALNATTPFTSASPYTIAFSGTGVSATATKVSATQLSLAVTVLAGATLGLRNITISGGASMVLASAFTVTAASVSPASMGQGAFTRTVTITGAAGTFPGTNTYNVAFSGTGITVNGTSWVSTSSVTASISISSGASMSLRTVSVSGTNSFTQIDLPNAFSVTAAPSVSSISPSSLGQGATSQNLTITGANFGSGTWNASMVSFSGSGITVNSVTLVNSTTLTVNVTVGAGAATVFSDVTVNNPDFGIGTGASKFFVSAAPTVSLISPNQLPTGATGQQVVITGTGFQGLATVAISGTNVTVLSLTVDSATQITAFITVAPGAAVGVRNITVTNPDFGTVTVAGGFTVIAGPTITGLTPAGIGQGTLNQTLTVTGTGFEPGAAVQLGGTGLSVGSTTYLSPTQLVITASAAAAATVGLSAVFVQNPDGGTFTLANAITVNTASVIPATMGQGATAQLVTIRYLGSATFTSGTFTATFSGTGVTATAGAFSNSTTVTFQFAVAAGATLGNRTITVLRNAVSVAVLTNAFAVTAGPIVTSVTPSSMEQGAQFQNVTVNGTNFVNGANVTFSTVGSAIVVSSTSFVDSSHLTANITVPIGATVGPRTVTVTNPDFGTFTTASGAFTVTGAPTISSASPSALGQGATGKDVILTGTGFVIGSAATFANAGITVNSTTYTSATSITANVTVAPNAPTGAGTITVTNPDLATGTSAAIFTINPSPTVTSISPATRAQGLTSDIVITGTGFISGAAVVFSGSGISINSTTFNSATQLTVNISIAGFAATGARDLTVNNPDFGSAALAGALTISPAPSVTGITPTSLGAGAVSQTVTITGTGFASGALVAFSGSGITVNGLPVVNSATSITANITITGGATPGVRNVLVTNTDGGVGTGLSLFTVNAAPAVTSLAPLALGQGATSQTVTITGSNFVSGATVSFGGAGVTVNGTPVFNSATSLTADVTVSAGATTGARSATVTNPDGGVGTGGTLTINAGPVVTLLTPSGRGQGLTNQNIVVTGTGFAVAAAAVFSGTGITVNSTTRNSATQLTINIDVAGAAAAGARDLTITNPDAGTTTALAAFSVGLAPTVVSVSPTSRGRNAANQDITITGTNFVNGAVAAFGASGITVNSTSYVNATTLTANITISGSATLGAGSVTVTNPDGGTDTTASLFTVTGAPTVGSVSPSALVKGAVNRNITVTGTGFVNGATASFGTGITTNSTAFVDSSHLTVNITVTTGAVTGTHDVTVTNPDAGNGTGTALFTVSDGPVVTSVSPTSRGQGASSQSIGVTGTGFQTGAAVTFSGTGITVNSTTRNSSTSLTVNITIAGSATVSARDVTVTNTDTGAGALFGGFTVDAGPVVSSIARTGLSSSNGASVSWTVTFSASVTGVVAGNFTLIPTSLGGTPAITGVTGSGTTWTVTASTGSGDGSLGLNATSAGSVAGPTAGTVQGLPVTGEVYTVDRTNPTASIDAKPANPSPSRSASFTISGSDPLAGGVASGVASLQCKLDAGSFAPCTSPVLYSSLSAAPHTFLVHAVDAAGNTGADATWTWTVSPATTTTVATSGTPSTYGDAVTFTATVSGSVGTPTGSVQFSIDSSPAGLPVTLDGAGQAALVISTLLVGPHTVSAAYSGDSSFDASSGSLLGGQTVNTKALTITANSQSKVYGAVLAWPAAGQTTFTTSTLVGSDSVASVTLSSTGAAGSAPVTTYPIVPSLAIGSGLANYAITYTNGTLTVGQAQLSVDASPTSKTYGAADPAFTYTISGYLNGQNQSTAGVTGNGSCGRAAGEGVTLSPYAITCSAGTLTALNYSFVTGATAAFTINKAPVTVNPGAGQTKMYGAADPVFTYAATGLVAGDTQLTAFTGALTHAVGTNVGTYAITIGTLAAANYNITFNGTRTFTITKAPITVAPTAGQSKAYGAVDPVLTFTATTLVNGDNNGTAFTGALTRAAGANVGVYSITVGTLASTNYTITFTPGVTFAISRAAVTVTPDGGQSKVYGAADPSVLTYTTSALVGSDTVSVFSGALSRVAGETVTGGPYEITQGTLAAANYQITIAPGVTFAITPAPVAVTPVAGQTKVYGTSDPVLTYTTSTLVGLDTIGNSFTGALTRDAGETVVGGPYAITQGSLIAANYAITFTPGVTFAVTKAAVTVIPDAGQTKAYGASDPTFSFTAPALVNGDTTVTAFGGSLSRASGEAVSTYAITQGTLSAANYTITFTAGVTFAVTKATVTVTPNSSQSKVYGGVDPTLSYTPVGLTNGDTGSVFTGALARATGEAVGNYLIGLGNLSAGSNYTTVLSGTPVNFAITKAAVTVTPDSGQGKVYGASDPVLTFTTTALLNGDSKSSAFSGALGRAAGSSVGSYLINSGSLASANYTVTFSGTPVNFAITPATVIVTPDSGQSKAYGASDPTLTYTSAGLTNNDTASVFSGALGRAAGTTVGTYAINLGTVSAGSNYTTVLAGATVTFAITKAAVTVTPTAGQTKVYGASDPVLAFTTSALVGSDTVGGSFTGALARVTGETVAGGPYAITLGTLASANYAISLTGGVTFAITKAAVTVTPTAGQTKVYGASDPALVFTTSALVGSDTIVGSFTGALARATGETVAGGPYTINQGTLASANYTIGFTGGVTFDITRAAVTVTPTAGQSKVYGASDPVLTYATSTLAGSDTIVSAFTGALVRVTGETVAGGPYTISQGTLAAANYTISFTGAVTFAITAATLTVTPDSGKTKVYGGSDPTFTYTSSGLTHGDSVSVFTGALARVAGTFVGSYAITIGSLAAGGNYAVTLAASPVTFSITPATVTVTPTSGQSKVYGTADATLAYTNSALVNGDTPSVFSGALSRASGEGVSTYAIALGTLSAGGNYTTVLAASPVTFAITKATLTVIPTGGQSKVYGASDTTLTYTSSGLANNDTATVFTGALTRAGGSNVGNYLISLGTVSGGANYTTVLSGTPVNFAITKATVTITPNSSQSKAFGDADPVFTYTNSALANGDSATVFGGALTRDGGEAVGAYQIRLGTLSAGSNYTTVLAAAPVFFAVGAQLLFVDANNTGKVYGAADPLSFTYHLRGFINGDDATSAGVTGIPSCSRATGQTVAASPYAITCAPGTLHATNYTIVTGDLGVFTISKAPVTVTPVSGQSKTYGASDPTLTFTTSVLVTGDTIGNAFTGALGRAAGNPVGTYAINVGTLAAANYSITLAVSPVLFTINKAPLTVDAVANTKVYGVTPDPAFTWNPGGLQYGESLITAGVSGVPTCSRVSGEAVSGSPYAISCVPTSGGFPMTAANYTIVAGASAAFTITPAAITVTPNSGLGKTYGAADPVLTYTFSPSTLPNGDTSAVFTGALSRAAGANVGSYAISQGNLAAGSNYTVTLSGSPVSFTISKATVTLDAVAAGMTKVYGATDPAFSFTYGGFQTGENIGNALGVTGAPTSCTRTPGETVTNSPYAITCGPGSLQATNYTFVQGASAAFTITKASRTITPTSGQTKVYGTADPTLTFTVSPALLFSDTIGNAFTGALSRAAGTAVGSYLISQGTLAAANYAITFSATPVNFAITAAPITVTATSGQTKVYGSADPALAFTVSPALVNGDNNASAFGSTTLTRATGESVGSYLISRGTLASGNYTITFAASPVNFAITKATLNVDATAAGKTYGSADPALVATLSGFVFSDGSGTSSITGAAVCTRSAGQTVGQSPYTISCTTGNLAAPNYVFAAGTTSLFAISPLDVTVTPDAGQSKSYGDAGDPTLTWTHSVLGFSDTNSVFTGSLTRVAGEDAGAYAIGLGTLTANANYNVLLAPSVVDFTIAPVIVTITPDAGLGMVWGDPTPTLTYTYAPNPLPMPVEATPPVFTGYLGSLNGVGSHPITIGSLSLGPNYTLVINPIPVNLEVTKGTLTVTAKDVTREYGTPTAFDYTLGGLAPGDSIESVAMTSTGSGATSAPNTYVITITGITAGSGTDLATNYDVLPFVAGTLTVTKGTTVAAVAFAAANHASVPYTGTAYTVTASHVTGPGGLDLPLTPVYTGECLVPSDAPGASACTATVSYAGDANYQPSSSFADLTILPSTVPVIVPPTPGITALATYMTSRSFPLAFATGGGTYPARIFDLRYRRAAYNGTFQTVPTEIDGISASSFQFTGLAGSTYCFSVRSYDPYSHTTGAWTAETCTAVPLDDRSLTKSSGWLAKTDVTPSRYYNNTYAYTTTLNKYVTRTLVQARRIAIVATTCSTCGSIKVYWNSKLIKTVSLKTTATVYHKVILVATFSSVQKGTLKLVVSTSGKRIYLDGVAIRRV